MICPLYCAVQVQDRQGEVVYQAELSALSNFYASSSDSSAPTDWLVVSHYNEDGTTGADSLYNPTTGEELTGYQQYTGAGTVSLYNSGRYQLVDLASTEQSAVLCEYRPARPVLPARRGQSRSRMPPPPKWRGGIRFHDLLTGEEKDLYDAGNTDDATLAIYALDGTVRVFDRQTGVLLTDTAIDPVENQVRAHVYAEGNGWVWVAQDDNDNYDEHGHPDLWAGRHPQNAGSPHAGRNLHPLLSPVFHSRWHSISTAAATAPAAAGCMTSWTATAMSSWAGCAACSTGIMPTAPTACRRVCLPPARDFLSGWMDLTGRWLYAESIFASTANDEMDNGYF